jgi:hypothetical protein
LWLQKDHFCKTLTSWKTLQSANFNQERGDRKNSVSGGGKKVVVSQQTLPIPVPHAFTKIYPEIGQ